MVRYIVAKDMWLRIVPELDAAVLYAAAGFVLRCVFLIPLVCIDEALCVDRDDLSAELRVVYPVAPGLVRKCSVFKIYLPVPWASESVLVRGAAMIRAAVLVQNPVLSDHGNGLYLYLMILELIKK